jgi:hypothetical protein
MLRRAKKWPGRLRHHDEMKIHCGDPRAALKDRAQDRKHPQRALGPLTVLQVVSQVVHDLADHSFMFLRALCVPGQKHYWRAGVFSVC